MKKIKASDATCQQLNWLVGTIEGRKPYYYGGVIRASGHPDFPDSPPMFGPELLYATAPAQTQSIIERCNVKIETRYDPSVESTKSWEASDDEDFFDAVYGPTREVAALRFFVSTELGEEVEVPDVLVSQNTGTSNDLADGQVYNHAFTIAFSVVSRNDAESVTGQELRAGLARRMRELSRRDGYDEIEEACGLPHDTFIYGPSDSFQLDVPDGQPPAQSHSDLASA